MSALDHPTMTTQRLVVVPTATMVMGLVRMQLVRLLARVGRPAVAQGWKSVQRRGEHLAVVLIGRSYQHTKQFAACLDDEMAFGSGPPPICRVGTRRVAPFLLEWRHCPAPLCASRSGLYPEDAPEARGARLPRRRLAANHVSGACNSSPSHSLCRIPTIVLAPCRVISRGTPLSYKISTRMAGLGLPPRLRWRSPSDLPDPNRLGSGRVGSIPPEQSRRRAGDADGDDRRLPQM